MRPTLVKSVIFCGICSIFCEKSNSKLTSTLLKEKKINFGHKTMSYFNIFYRRIKISPSFDISDYSAFIWRAKRVSQSKIVAVTAWKAAKTRDFEEFRMISEPGFGHKTMSNFNIFYRRIKISPSFDISDYSAFIWGAKGVYPGRPLGVILYFIAFLIHYVNFRLC